MDASVEGLPGVLGNKGTLAKYRREQGNMVLFLGNRATELYKLEEENIVSKFITRGTNTENVREHGAILDGNKDLPWETLSIVFINVFPLK